MDSRKLVQALAYIASKQPNHKMDAWKAYKLLWIADRYHLRQYGRMVTGDVYYALPHGPVPSDAKNIIEGEPLRHMTSNPEYESKYLKALAKSKYEAIAEPDMKVFSQTDVEALDKAYEAYGQWDVKELEQFSHQYPDWIAYKELIERDGEKDAHPIDMNLFFQNAQHEDSPLFKDDSAELLSLTRELYFQYHRA